MRATFQPIITAITAEISAAFGNTLELLLVISSPMSYPSVFRESCKRCRNDLASQRWVNKFKQVFVCGKIMMVIDNKQEN